MPSQKGESECGNDSESNPHSISFGSDIRAWRAQSLHDVISDLKRTRFFSFEPVFRSLPLPQLLLRHAPGHAHRHADQDSDKHDVTGLSNGIIAKKLFAIRIATARTVYAKHGQLYLSLRLAFSRCEWDGLAPLGEAHVAAGVAERGSAQATARDRQQQHHEQEGNRDNGEQLCREELFDRGRECVFETTETRNQRIGSASTNQKEEIIKEPDRQRNDCKKTISRKCKWC